ncbi:MAG: Asp-tRNA(Asn)/Glu-tRNA(Gln) amidotransferase subunit GatC [Phycisphaerales bacterium]
MAEPLSESQVRHIAKLSRLSVSAEEVERYRAQLADVLDHMRALSALDLSGVEPMAHVSGAVNRLDDDEPGPMLAREVLMALAPATDPPFVKVPKVIGDGGGA